jgi:hypothetical protein
MIAPQRSVVITLRRDCLRRLERSIEVVELVADLSLNLVAIMSKESLEHLLHLTHRSAMQLLKLRSTV